MAGDINRAFDLIVSACNDPNIGYSQARRTTISLGVTQKTYCDCSSLISWACALSGFAVNNPWFTTSNMRTYLTQWGFKKVDINGEWKPGDVVWKVRHTEMVHNDHVTMGAHTEGVAFADQVSINPKPTASNYYTEIYRFGDGATGGGGDPGISMYVVAAICGNFSRESTVNPGLWEGLTPGTGGFGLGQWTGGRRDNLFAWMDDHGYSRDDGDGQIEFLVAENEWQKESSQPLEFDSLTDFIMSTSTDIPALTETYMNAWERPGIPELEERIEFAEKALKHIQEHGNESATWIVSNSYLSEAERLNNVLCVWQKLGILFPGSGGQGWSGTLRHGAARELYRRRYIWR